VLIRLFEGFRQVQNDGLKLYVLERIVKLQATEMEQNGGLKLYVLGAFVKLQATEIEQMAAWNCPDWRKALYRIVRF